MTRSKEQLYAIDITKGELIILYNELFVLEDAYGNRVPFEEVINSLKTIFGAAWRFKKIGIDKPKKPLFGNDQFGVLLTLAEIINESHEVIHIPFTIEEIEVIRCMISVGKSRFEREILWDGWDQFKGVLKQIEKHIGKMR